MKIMVEEQAVDTVETEETPVEEIEEVQADEIETEDEESTEETEDEEVVYTFGEDSPPQDDDELNSEVPKKLRQEIRERNKRIKELEAQVEANKPKEQMPTLGVKPTLEDCDYDEDTYSQKLDEWYAKKQEVDRKQAEIESNKQKEKQAWENTLNNYVEQRSNIKAQDFEDAESVVMDLFDQTQQGMLIQGATNAATLVYALGKNPEKAKELASIKDPVKFAWAASKLEGSMKTTNRKPTVKPEKVVKGSGSLSGTVDAQLDKLRAEAAKTGDYSKVHAYKRSLNK